MVESTSNTSRGIEPYPGGNRWHLFRASYVNQQVENTSGEIRLIAKILSRFIFETHPHVADYSPAMRHRYDQALKVASFHPGCSELLTDEILAHFCTVEGWLKNGYTYAPTSVMLRFDGNLPQPTVIDGQQMQKIKLPKLIQQRTIAWNNWAQEMVKAGNVDQLFREHPYTEGIKPAEGLKLPVGNLVVEMTEGIARLRGDTRFAGALEQLLTLPTNPNGVGQDLDLWFVMTHIMEKDMLDLAMSIGEDMVDGRQLTPAVYSKSYEQILNLMDVNPHLPIQGVLSDGTWAYSPELKKVFPNQHVSQLHDIAGRVVSLGPAEQIGLLNKQTLQHETR